MLTLKRRPGESIRIGDDIVVTLVWSKGGEAELAIDAPYNIRIVRSEIQERGRMSPGRRFGNNFD
jgi:carbon storage regulator